MEFAPRRNELSRNIVQHRPVSANVAARPRVFPLTSPTDPGIDHRGMPNTEQKTREYLHASGAAAIWITERYGVCSIHTGRFVGKSRETISTYWTAEQDRAQWRGEARRLADVGPDA